MTGSVTKKKLDLGLNQRGVSKKRRKKNVLDDDDDSSSDVDDGSVNEKDGDQSSSLRAKVNQEIAHEQAALRKRAQAAAAAAAATTSHNDFYDYDGAYDSFQPEQIKKDTAQTDNDSGNKGSRYIGDLLKAAEHRKREREMVLERKIARELQAEEEQDDDVRGKEKFITAAYRRKLQERELWHAEEAKKLQDEEENDVTKRTDAGVAIATFYGNLNKNVAMGGAKETASDYANETDDANNAREASPQTEENVASRGFLDGFEKGDSENDKDNEQQDRVDENEKDATASQSASDAQMTKRQSVRQLREEKVKQARIRYFQRHGISTNGKDKISMSHNQ